MTSSETFFSALKIQRESKGIEIQEISDYTKINPRYFTAIEAGDFSLLPDVYMRLFLRSYAMYIGADSQQALEDYELHTTGIVKSQLEFAEKKEPEVLNPEETKPFQINNEFQISTKKIGTVAGILITLFIAFKLLNSITEDQIKTTPLPVLEQVENQDEPSDSESTIEAEEQTTVVIQTPSTTYSSLPDLFPLNATNFKAEKLIGTETQLLDISSPVKLKISTLSQTKLHIEENDQILINAIVPADTSFSFDINSLITFDLWSAKHIKASLNDLSIDSYFKDEDVAIRGSFEVSTSKLYVSFYSH